ncbi:hypothetical protein NUW54_g1723 [Trametes sanguinea]|uniref:Uncharacterized protein n=1 Tax=Trametes sanguinea TaxID=158606 RepID=A0ACC1Q5T5_9APHY|nr:hypothetical protein NUW54_g1723 [Trametes sanguinea]
MSTLAPQNDSWNELDPAATVACPELPDFQSLILKGPYHASAPVHLLLSHTAQHPDAKAILLTPSRRQFKTTLGGLNDEWLSQKSGHGRVCAGAQRTEVFYPPTLAHLRLLLSMLHEYHGAVHDAKTTLDIAPSMLILHEVSSYFNAPSSEATVSAYLSVISSALALTNSWSPQCLQASKLVVFDSGLADLKLPILKPLAFGDSAEEPQRNRGTLAILLERYFEWTAEVQIGECLQKSPGIISA